MNRVGWFIAAIFSLAVLGQAQTAPSLVPRTASERERQQESNNQILLNVQVTDSAGQPVSGLTRDDFTVLDDQQPQKIVMFREVESKDRPVHVLIVFDAINAEAWMIRHAREDLANYLARRRGRPLPYPISLVLVSDTGTTESPFTTDPAALSQHVAEMPRSTHGTSCNNAGASQELDDLGGGAYATPAPSVTGCSFAHMKQSVAALSSLLKEQTSLQGRTILIWTGPGWSLPKQATGNFLDVLVELTTNMRIAQTTLYAVSPDKFERVEELPHRQNATVGEDISLANQTKRDQAALRSTTLPILARQSGGRVFEKTNLDTAIDACFVGLSRYYLIAWDPAPSATPDNVRTIDVTVKPPNLKVLTTTSYFAQP
jgi:VWFA-related protein